jgi:tetratricopeptide (TPR) repeat protein
LGQFWDADSLERRLADVRENSPELSLNEATVRHQGLQKLSDETPLKRADPDLRVEKIRRAIRSLQTLLAEEEDQAVLEEVSPQLGQLRARLAGFENENTEEIGRARIHLSPRRRRFDPCEREAGPYLEALEQGWRELEREERWQECVEVAHQRVEACPDEESGLRYGHLLHKLGRTGEAIEQYRRLSRLDPVRNYNLVAACWRENRKAEALDFLLSGLAADPDGLWRQDYWDRFGGCWSEAARNFVQSILRQPLVNTRKFVPKRSRGWLLTRAITDSETLKDRPFERKLPRPS